MNGQELIEWINDEKYGRGMAGAYLAGFLHGQVTCEKRVSEFSHPLNIPTDLDVPILLKHVLKVSETNPQYLDLDIATFMYAVFESEFS